MLQKIGFVLIAALAAFGLVQAQAPATQGPGPQTAGQGPAPQGRGPQPLRVTAIKEGKVYWVAGGGGNSGVIIGDNGVIVIDAKTTPDAAKQLIAEVAKLTPKPITDVIITHSDGDHLNGLEAFADGVNVIAHVNNKVELRYQYIYAAVEVDGGRCLPPLNRLPNKVVTRDNVSTKIQGVNFTFRHFGPAHTSGDLIVVLPDERVAFTGDLITSTVLIHTEKNGSLDGWFANAKGLLSLNVDSYIGGHSNTPDTKATLQKRIDDYQAQRDKVHALMKEGKSLADVKKAMNDPAQNPAGCRGIPYLSFAEVSYWSQLDKIQEVKSSSTAATATFSPRADAFDRVDTRRRIRAILVGSMGNLIEWFDVYTYAAFALYFAASFFPSGDPVVQQLSAATVFAVGFIARPFGGLLFGHLADRHGRRNALMWSVLLMCFGSLLIATAPTYATIGVWAPVLLTVARVLQGISQGGEYGTSATYLSEIAHPNRRGFYSGIWFTTLIGGQLCAISLLLVLQKIFLTPEQLRSWGWRIPFVIGAALAVYTMWMRRDMHESDHFHQAKAVAKTNAGLRVLLTHWKPMLLVIGITVGGTSAFYTYTTYMQKFLKLSVGLSDDQTTLVVTIALIFAIVLQPLCGALSDRVGRKPLLVAFGVLGTLFTYPLLVTLQQTKSPVVATLLICAAWAIVSLYTSITAIIKAELFPTNVRALGVGLPYALTASIFGGTVDSVALGFKNIGHETWFFWYATACILVSLLFYLFMPDMKRHSRMEQHA